MGLADDGGGTLYWDNIFIPNGPSGTWDTTNPFWNANPTRLPAGPLTTWVQGDSAVFSASTLGATGSFNVTLSQNVVVANLTYTGGSPGSQLSLSVGGANAIIMQNLQMTVAVDANTTLFVQPAIVSGGLGGSLVLQSGNLILAGANTYGGGTTINAGSNLQIGDGVTTGSIVRKVADHGSLAFGRTDAVTFSGNVSGTGTLSQIGSGTLTLTGTNTYSGGTIISH